MKNPFIRTIIGYKAFTLNLYSIVHCWSVWIGYNGIKVSERLLPFNWVRLS